MHVGCFRQGSCDHAHRVIVKSMMLVSHFRQDADSEQP